MAPSAGGRASSYRKGRTGGSNRRKTGRMAHTRTRDYLGENCIRSAARFEIAQLLWSMKQQSCDEHCEMFTNRSNEIHGDRISKRRPKGSQPESLQWWCPSPTQARYEPKCGIREYGNPIRRSAHARYNRYNLSNLIALRFVQLLPVLPPERGRTRMQQGKWALRVLSYKVRDLHSNNDIG